MPAVILCEKRSQARELANALGEATGEGPGWIDCPAGRLTWASGRLLKSARPEKYDPRYAEWDLDHLPIVPKAWILEAREGVEEQLNAALSVLHSATSIYIATDASREGELIAYELIERAGVCVPIKRLWFSARDEESLRTAWAHAREGSETVRLYHAALTRQRTDWLFQVNLRRASTLAFGEPRRALFHDRILTPTLALIVQRDREIERFHSQEYFEVRVQIRSGLHRTTMHYVPTEREARLMTREEANQVVARLRGATGTIRLTREAHRQAPPRPYALSDLQRDANARFGYSAQVTSDLAQALYEKHRAVTHPRSDCEFLPSQMAREVPAILRSLIHTQVLPHHPDLEKPLLRKAYFDDAGLTDHHAIVPTSVRPPVEQMSDAERNVFGLIATRFAQILRPDYEYESSTMMMTVNGVHLRAQGRRSLRLGWKEFEPAALCANETAEDEPESFARIRDGSPGEVDRAGILRKVTHPPVPYTEGTLLHDMKHVHDLVEQPLIEKGLKKKTSGLGTETTCAGVIEGLKRRRLIKHTGRDKRAIRSTWSGQHLIEVLPKELTMPDFAVASEDLLASVAAGTCSAEEALASLTTELYGQLTLVLRHSPALHNEDCATAPRARTSSSSGSPARNAPSQTGGLAEGTGANTPHAPRCQRCGKPMKWRTNGATQVGFWGCSGYPSCKGTRSAEFHPEKECPTCSRPMELKQGSRGPFFGCTGYPTNCRHTEDAAAPGAQSS